MAQLLSGLPRVSDPRALVGFEGSDDAAVFRLGDAADPNATALLATIDFFTPVVESPFDFGRIAAANALSDVYAMGGEPLFALNVVGFPRERLPLEVLAEILRGGAAAATEAGMAILGGHSTDFDVPVYGLSVTGHVAVSRVRRNTGARAGDALVLTKAIGTGILTSALRARALAHGSIAGLVRRTPSVSPEEERGAVESMARLNRGAARAADAFDVSASTDVTGYGLLGHLREMLGPASGREHPRDGEPASGREHPRTGEPARAALLDAEISASAVPILAGARRLAADRVAPEGSEKNLAAARPFLDAAPAVSETDLLLLADAQTSGGLLLAIPELQAEEFVRVARTGGDTPAARIGTFLPGSGRIRIVR